MKSLELKFLEEIGHIKDPEIFLGVARILKAKLINEEKKEPYDFQDILEETMRKFHESSRSRKKELLKILRAANKAPASVPTSSQEVVENGN